jgi:hypothetical protein
MRFVVGRNVVMRRIPVYGLKCYQRIFWSQSLSRYPVVQCIGNNFWTLRNWNWYGAMLRDHLLKFCPDTYSIYLVQEACNALGVIEWVTCTLVAMLRVASDIDSTVGWGSVLCEVRGDALETYAYRACNNVAEPDGSTVIGEINT